MRKITTNNKGRPMYDIEELKPTVQMTGILTKTRVAIMAILNFKERTMEQFAEELGLTARQLSNIFEGKAACTLEEYCRICATANLYINLNLKG